MAPPQKGGGSAAESLKNVLGEIAQIATMPDADPKFFTMIQQAITQYLRQNGNPQGPQPGQGPGGPGQPPPGMGPMPPGAGPQAPPPGPPGLGGGAQGLSMTGKIGAPGANVGPTGGTPPPTSPDELRRILGAGQ